MNTRLCCSEGLAGPLATSASTADAAVESCSVPRTPTTSGALDFQFDETAEHRCLKLLHIFDEHTPEAVAMRAGRTCDTDQVAAVIEALVVERGTPGHLRLANGP
jgi:hypothetical protein